MENSSTPLPVKFQRHIDAMRKKIGPLKGMVSSVQTLSEQRGDLEIVEPPEGMLAHIATSLESISENIDRLEALKVKVEELAETTEPSSTSSEKPQGTRTTLGKILIRKDRC